MPAAALKQRFFRLPFWMWILLGALVAGGLLAYALNQPKQGSWRYGVCRVFVEETLRFPDTIKMLIVSEGQLSVRLIYSSINANGAQRVQDFECYFNTAPNGAPQLTRIMVDRKPLSDEKVANFNRQLPIILTQELNTVLPSAFPSDIKNYR